ncbi:MAG: hypothetical protein AABW47_01620 [Nanoarchaeota archaeon]
MNKTQFPTSFMGVDSEEAYERIMNEKESAQAPITTQTSFNLPNPNIPKSDYIQIPKTEKVISKFELQEYDNLTWKDTHFKLHENGLYMPVIPLFMTHFMNVLNSYKSKGKMPLFDASGNPISKKEIEDIYLHLTKDHIAIYGNQAGAWTWLDAFFKDENGTMKILSEHKTIVNNGNKTLEAQKTENLENCLTEDCFSDLKFNSQGLPISKSSSQKYRQGNNLYSWFPRIDRVAGFVANSGRAFLNCYRIPSCQNPILGVFGVAQSGL